MATFNFSYAPGVSLQQMVGFEMAGAIWASYLQDNVSVNIHVEVSDKLQDKVLGGALPGLRANQKVEDVTKALAGDRTSNNDYTAVANLPGKDVSVISNADSEVKGNKTMNITTANAKAMGLIYDSSSLDGYIMISNLKNQSVSWNYDFTRSAAAPASTVDFLSTALHEIAHILGFKSGVDAPGWLTVINDAKNSNKNKMADGSMTFSTPLDFYRYSTLSSGNKGRRDLSIGGNAYFSINGGGTALASFASGKATNLGGDGHQASHWKHQSNPVGLLDPTMASGQRLNISSLDLLAMDVIGWNLPYWGVNLNFSALQTQAQQRLAGQLGISVNALLADTASVQGLTRDRTTDVNAMITESEVYEWGRSGSGSSSGGARGSGGRQELLDLMAQEGAWSMIEDEPDAPAYDSVKLFGRVIRTTGTNGDDVLLGTEGRDQLLGKDGSDMLSGSGGNDSLVGGYGDDILSGGQGKDILVGGKGSDRFVLELNSGCDLVRDFQAGEDQIFLGSSLQFSDLSFRQQGKSTLISYESNALMVLQNVNANSITAADFV
jgi:Ca2+-binding RTX toxin-like protein